MQASSPAQLGTVSGILNKLAIGRPVFTDHVEDRIRIPPESRATRKLAPRPVWEVPPFPS